MVRSCLNDFSVYQTDNLSSYFGKETYYYFFKQQANEQNKEMGYYWGNGKLIQTSSVDPLGKYSCIGTSRKKGNLLGANPKT